MRENIGRDETNLLRKIHSNIRHDEFFPVADRDYKVQGVLYEIGNLRDNATLIADKGILFDGNKAPYISYLELGTYKMQQHMGFIGEKGTAIAAETIRTFYESKGCSVIVKKGR